MAELSRQILSLCQMGAGRDAGRGLVLEVERAQLLCPSRAQALYIKPR